jgi:hypothetical protein
VRQINRWSNLKEAAVVLLGENRDDHSIEEASEVEDEFVGIFSPRN